MKRLAYIAVALILSLGCDLKTSGSESCGDGVIDQGEDCDGTNRGDSTCFTLGYYGGELACSDTCQFNTTACETAGICGDGVRQAEHEACDQEAFGDNTCANNGFDGGTLRCTTDCELDTSHCFTCGDGALDEGEECEEGDLNGNTCESLGYYGGTLTCRPDTCTFNVTSCESFGACGDGVFQSAYEQCEGSNLGDFTDCHSYNSSYYNNPDTALSCGNDCEIDISQCEYCGDSTIQESYGEVCDPASTDGALCADHYFGGGISTCFDCSSVTFDTCTISPFSVIRADITADFSCGLAAAGHGLWCWGTNTAFNYLIPDSPAPSPVLVQMSDKRYTDFATSFHHTCALDFDGVAWCWGTNNYGCLGQAGITTYTTTPVEATSTHGVYALTRIGAGNNFNCGIDLSGQAWCWGLNNHGQLGDGSTGSTSDVQMVIHGAMGTLKQIAVGIGHTCALTHTGEVWCWGLNENGECGATPGTDQTLPHRVTFPGAAGVITQISTGSFFSCAVADTGDAYCWGENEFTKLGNSISGTFTELPTLVDRTTAGAGLFQQVSCGADHACAVDDAGAVYCWGSGAHQAIGVATTLNYASPVNLPSGVIMQSVSAGNTHTCARDSEGHAWCWGSGTNGQLGNGSSTNSPAPVQVVATP